MTSIIGMLTATFGQGLLRSCMIQSRKSCWHHYKKKCPELCVPNCVVPVLRLPTFICCGTRAEFPMICWDMLGYAGIWTGLVGSLPCHASFSAFLPWSVGGDSWGTVGLVLLLILRALQGLSAGVVDFWLLERPRFHS